MRKGLLPRSPGRRWVVCGCLAASVWTGAPPALADGRLVLNEVLPDPAGTDEGREFVELYNAGDEVVPLAGVQLQFANGAVAPLWLTRWTGGQADAVDPGAFFLITDRNWQGEAVPDAEVYLGLQNGPDAVRLAGAQGELDLIGYGALTDPQLCEGTPVAVVSGRSLARRPDGRDTGDNAADCVSAEPTPGARNFLDFALTLDSWSCEPPSADRPGIELQVTATLRNTGLAAWPAGWAVLRAGGVDHLALLDSPQPGQLRQLLWIIRASDQPDVLLSLHCPPGDGGDTLSFALGRLQLRPGRIILNEIQPAPQQGQGEWIELACLGPDPVNLADCRLRDEDGPWRVLPPLMLQPGELAVLAQDSVALAGWIAANVAAADPAVCPAAVRGDLLRELGSWPSLNNTAPEGRTFADRVCVADSTGTVIDHVTIGGGQVQSAPQPRDGRSLERVADQPQDRWAANWALGTSATEGTPGCRNSVAVAAGPFGTVSVQPLVLDPQAGDTTLAVSWSVSAPAVGCRVQVYDLWGVPVRDLGGDGLGPGPRLRLWDGRDRWGRPVPAGGYVILVTATTAAGRVLASEKILVAAK